MPFALPDVYPFVDSRFGIALDLAPPGVFPFVLAVAGAFAVAAAVAGAGVAAVTAISAKAIAHRRHGVFLTLFLAAMILSSLVVAELLSANWVYWRMSGPIILFLGLLTLLNAPFDWAALGLTRALLRRGLELGGWWPYLLALVDACLAGVIIALLALTMVIGVQAFDELAVHGRNAGIWASVPDYHRREQEEHHCGEGFLWVAEICLRDPEGERAAVLPLDFLFDGIAKNPGAPECWWAYALLLSSMIPSLVNLAIGGMVLTRGIPGVGRFLLNWIPEGRDVPDYRRPLAAIGLTVQMFVGAFLGIAAQAFLAWGLIFHSCRGPGSTCSTWPAPSRISTFRRGQDGCSQASFRSSPRAHSLPVMHLSRNSLRALPCKPCASAFAVHSLASADIGAFGAAGAAGVVACSF